jgi:hypothetical protein
MLIPAYEGTEVRPVSTQKDAKILLRSGLTLAEIVHAATRPKDLTGFSMW